MKCKECKYFKLEDEYGRNFDKHTFGICSNENLLVIDEEIFSFEQEDECRDDMLLVDNSDDPYTFSGIFVCRNFGCIHFENKK